MILQSLRFILITCSQLIYVTPTIGALMSTDQLLEKRNAEFDKLEKDPNPLKLKTADKVKVSFFVPRKNNRWEPNQPIYKRVVLPSLYPMLTDDEFKVKMKQITSSPLDEYYEKTTANEEESTYRYFTSTDLKFCNKAFNETNKLMNTSNTIVYFTDFKEDYFSQSARTIVDAFLKLGEYNLIVFDWSNYNRNEDIKEFRLVSHSFTVCLHSILRSTNTFYFIASGLGNKIAMQAEAVASKSWTLMRYTALDPVGSWMTNRQMEIILLKSITQSYKRRSINVDIYWTDIAPEDEGMLPIGSHDFIINNGHSQPHCVIGFSLMNFLAWFSQSSSKYCSHQRSWIIFAKTVTEDSANFMACNCLESRLECKSGRCGKKKQVKFGYNRDKSLAKGVYYVHYKKIKYIQESSEDSKEESIEDVEEEDETTKIAS